MLPVAAVLVDSGLAHLDREFEYAVPPELSEAAQPGVRVKVRFAGRDRDGFVVERRANAEHGGTLTPLRSVVSPEPVLTPQVLALARSVARHYGGTTGDVLRLAIPKRHARAEKRLDEAASSDGPVVPDGPDVPGATDGPDGLDGPDVGPWSAYQAGPAFVRRLAAGEAPAASWLARPGVPKEQDWPAAIAAAAAVALIAGRGVVIVVPDRRDVDRVDAALTLALGRRRHVRLTADQGPQARYTAWLSLLRGHIRCVVGTRAAAFAPVRDLGLLVCWDEGDDLHAEQRAPYPHTREVLRLRAAQCGGALLLGGFARSVEVAGWVRDGAVRTIAVDPHVVRRCGPRVVIAGEAESSRDGATARARLPGSAWRTAVAALQTGPVLIQVPRGGYVPSLRCADCGEPARCASCHGPLGLGARDGRLACRWCGRDAPVVGYACPSCEGTRLRSGVVGADRTAEELGRAFPGVPVVESVAGAVKDSVPPGPALVVATPGAEPVAEGGYAAVLLLDAWAMLDLPTADAAVEACRRWLAAAALARGAGAEGERPTGVVVLCGVPEGVAVPEGVVLPAVEALVRWDPAWVAQRELAERDELFLPPAAALASLVGTRSALARGLDLVRWPDGVERIGPVPYGPADGLLAEGALSELTDAQWRLLLRAPSSRRDELADAVRAVRSQWSARKEPGALMVRMDPDPRS